MLIHKLRASDSSCCRIVGCGCEDEGETEAEGEPSPSRIAYHLSTDILSIDTSSTAYLVELILST